MTRTLDALVPYYGCKRQMADRIVEALGEHAAYWEPLCGSCAVFFAKPRARMEVLVDLHGPIINLAQVVQSDTLSVRLFEKLYRTAFAQKIHADSAEWLKAQEDSAIWLERHEARELHPVEWAYHYFIASWQGRNGLCGTEKELETGFCKRHTSNGGDPATRFRHAVESIPSWWERLRGATILQEDGIALVPRIEDKAGTVIYCDPPYLDKDASYKHDFTPEQHQALAAQLSRFQKTRVVVSYYDHPLLDVLYPPDRWEKRAIKVAKNLSVKTGAQSAPEVLLINRT